MRRYWVRVSWKAIVFWTVAWLCFFVVFGCVNADHSWTDLVTPDEFHVYYSEGESNASGSIGPPRDTDRFESRSHADTSSWTAGWSWDLIGPGPAKDAIRDEARRQLRTLAKMAAESAIAAAMERLDDDIADAVKLLREVAEEIKDR